MTEAIDRPPDQVAAASGEAAKPYSSVSMLAIGGFAVAFGYSVVIGVGALIALFNRTPWVLPSWSLVFPVAAVVVCWAARSRILSSEGTLTGMKLTTWGLYLSFGFGLVYGAYYAACYLSVTQMAKGFADDWIQELKTDQLDKAFLRTISPPRPNPDANLRNRLELEYDRGPNGRGKFTEFRQSHLIHLFGQGDAQVEFLGVENWGYEPGGYKVQLAYRITSAAITTELQVTAVGVENVDDSGNRQWFVKDFQPRRQVLTAQGTRITALGDQARAFAQKWMEKVGDWKWDEAYLDTLTPAERERQVKDRGADLAEGLKKFRAGDFVWVADTFWPAGNDKEGQLVLGASTVGLLGSPLSQGPFLAASALIPGRATDKEQVVAKMKGLFGRGGEDPDQVMWPPAPPTFRQDLDQVRIGLDVAFPLPPDQIVQCRLMVAADARNADPTPADWRIESLELLSAKRDATRGPDGQEMPRDVKAPGRP
jgi:hypothetical protein